MARISHSFAIEKILFAIYRQFLDQLSLHKLISKEIYLVPSLYCKFAQ